jgi:hypothetical protein
LEALGPSLAVHALVIFAFAMQRYHLRSAKSKIAVYRAGKRVKRRETAERYVKEIAGRLVELTPRASVVLLYQSLFPFLLSRN